MAGPKKAKTAYAAALELLSQRALSEAELCQRLLRQGFGVKEVERVLARLRRAGLVSDVEVARMVVRSKLESGHGPWALRASLRRRGISLELEDRVLGELSPEARDKALSVAVERALRRFQGEDTSVRRKKVVRYLLSRGFGLAEVMRVTAFLGGVVDDEELVEPGYPEEVS